MAEQDFHPPRGATVRVYEGDRRGVALKLEFAKAAASWAFPKEPIRSDLSMPWGLLMEEAAFQPEAGEAYYAAVPVCQKIIVVSSAGPDWFADFVTEAI